jgi:hypothetical protein
MPTVLSPSNAFPGAPFPQHGSGLTATARSYVYPGAVQPQSTSPTVLSYAGAFPAGAFPQHGSGLTATVQSFVFPGAVQPVVAPASHSYTQTCLGSSGAAGLIARFNHPHETGVAGQISSLLKSDSAVRYTGIGGPLSATAKGVAPQEQGTANALASATEHRTALQSIALAVNASALLARSIADLVTGVGNATPRRSVSVYESKAGSSGGIGQVATSSNRRQVASGLASATASLVRRTLKTLTAQGNATGSVTRGLMKSVIVAISSPGSMLWALARSVQGHAGATSSLATGGSHFQIGSAVSTASASIGKQALKFMVGQGNAAGTVAHSLAKVILGTSAVQASSIWMLIRAVRWQAGGAGKVVTGSNHSQASVAVSAESASVQRTPTKIETAQSGAVGSRVIKVSPVRVGGAGGAGVASRFVAAFKSGTIGSVGTRLASVWRWLTGASQGSGSTTSVPQRPSGLYVVVAAPALQATGTAYVWSAMEELCVRPDNRTATLPKPQQFGL